LGHIISAKGVDPDPEKVIAIHNWPQPRSLTELRGFLDLTGFYRKFVYHYATLIAPLTDLLHNKKFTWSVSAHRDPLFVSTLWKHLFKAQGTTLKFSSSYHPQTDRQTKVLNRSLEYYLRCFAREHPHTWFQYLHLA